MKAEGLVVGDLLTFKDCVGDSGFPILKVNGILPDTLFVRIDYSDADDEVDYEDIIGIPLTPEILEKNGFENDFYVDESVADYLKVRNEGYSLRCTAHGWDAALVTWCNGHVDAVTDFSGEFRGDIEYVHQLQHALRLCGIDKEIFV